MESTHPQNAAPELFGTETMAELCARQGRVGEAIAIYRRLIETRPEDPRHGSWQRRCADLERANGRVAPTPGVPERVRPLGVEASPAPPAPPAAEPTRVPPPPPPATRPFELPMVVTQPVRSGQVIYARSNDLIVLGAVNPGAQVVADGNVHIYGPLRGRAIAGAQGHDAARIFCQRLDAELLAINGIYLVWEDIPAAWRGQPARISLQDGRCCIGPLFGAG